MPGVSSEDAVPGESAGDDGPGVSVEDDGPGVPAEDDEGDESSSARMYAGLTRSMLTRILLPRMSRVIVMSSRWVT